MKGKFLIYVMHIRQLYEKMLEECSVKLGLSQLEINILLFLENHPSYNTARDICNMRMIPKSNASNGIRLLERKGLIRIQLDGENIKLHRLFLTEKSKTYTEYLINRQKEFMDIFREQLTQDEIETVQMICEKLDSCAKKLL